MAKRSGDDSLPNSKRKHNSLTITRKVELLRKLEKGTSVRKLCEEYEIGKSTVYDLQKQKTQILQFYADSDTQKAMEDRKTMRSVKNVDVDKVMMEWIRQRRSESVPLTGPMIMAQAKLFHSELDTDTQCDYSTGWLTKFKRRHGIRHIRICGEKASADHEAAESFIDEFSKFVADENLAPEQVYNADETSLFWRYVPRKTMVTAEEVAPSGVKDAKERLTVLACANAAGTHKCKLLVIGKSVRPRAFKGVKVFPVNYKANKRAWITKELMIDWFKNYFVKEVRSHFKNIGLPEDSKIVLVLDNCSAHPAAEFLVERNVHVVFLPPNCTSLIQPMDMGVLRAMKCRYKNEFLTCMLSAINNGVKVPKFVKEYNVKDAVWSVARAWNDITPEILKHAWHNLWPSTVFTDDDAELENYFEGFRFSKSDIQRAELLEYAKNMSSINLVNDDIEEVMHIDDDGPIVNKLTDSEICSMVLDGNEDSDNESVENNAEEKMPIDKLIETVDLAIKGLEQREFITEQELMSMYKIREKLASEKPKLMKQLTISDMFRCHSNAGISSS